MRSNNQFHRAEQSQIASIPVFMATMEQILEHKAAGNDAYKAGDMADAIGAYSQAVNLLPKLRDPDPDSSDEEDAKDESVDIASVDAELAKQG